MRTVETRLQDLQSLRESGLTLGEIGAQVGVSKSTVFRRISSAASAAYRRKQPDRVTREQLEECRSDPAWELRPPQEIAD